ncbi:MAG: ABC transporter substrate-binding protein [Candidatus Aminicenantes bacterium]|nr:ABC transporter substrate-binding protein [Candidatus Aminicenantes bacterium]
MRERTRSSVALVGTVILMFFLLIILGGGQSPLKKISFMPQWFPQAEFAGYYVALDKGIYKKYGIDLTIMPGGAERSSVDYVASKKADFGGTWLSTAIQKRAQGLKIVNIAQVIQRSALMFIVKKSSGIETPQDMNGKKVGLWRGDFQLQPQAFFKKYNLKVKVIPQPFSTDYIDLFLMDALDVATAMWYNEYHLIINCGLNPDELNTFFFHDYGLNFPENGIYVLEETYRKDPELCCAFVRATMEGWEYCFEHHEEALDIVIKYMKELYIPASRVHQRWMLERMIDIIQPLDRSVPLGTLLPEDYERVAQTLKESRLIKEVPSYEEFYKKCQR